MTGAGSGRAADWPEPRIGDVEREGAAWALGEHFAAGRLTQDEYDERAGLAWEARTHSDLAPLFGDLPQPHGRPAARTAPVAVPPPPRPRPRRRWNLWLALLVALFAVGAMAEEPFLVVLVVVALVVLLKKRCARRRADQGAQHRHHPH